jgi:hypothetical protein
METERVEIISPADPAEAVANNNSPRPSVSASVIPGW